MNNVERQQQIDDNHAAVKRQMVAALARILSRRDENPAALLGCNEDEWADVQVDPTGYETDIYVAWFVRLGYDVTIQVAPAKRNALPGKLSFVITE